MIVWGMHSSSFSYQDIYGKEEEKSLMSFFYTSLIIYQVSQDA